MKCIFCQQELTRLSSNMSNYYFCVPCFQKELIAVLYSYDSWNDRFISIYMDYYHNNEHIRVGIQPFHNVSHVIYYEHGKFLTDTNKLIINVEGAMHVMLHPHAHIGGKVELRVPITTLLTPQNVRDKISLYQLFS